MKKFYEKNKKAILFTAGFIAFVLIAATIINGVAVDPSTLNQ